MKASSQKLPIYPYTGFPFEGKTDLNVSGKWLPFGDKENDTFLVYRMNTCTHPFPFKKLAYDLADSAVRAGNGGDGKSKAGGTAKGGSDNAQLVNKEPGNNRVQRSAVFTTKTKFPDLEEKPVWRIKAEAMGSADVFLRKADGTLEQIAFGESGYTTDYAGLDLQQCTPRLWKQAPARHPELSRKVVDPRLKGTFTKYFLPNTHEILWVGEPRQMDRRLVAQSGTFVMPGVLDKSLDQIISNYDTSEGLLHKVVLNQSM